MSPSTITAVESALSYIFIDKSLLIRALTPQGYANEQRQRGKACKDNRAFRTLGDSILKTALIELLMEHGYDTGGDITQHKQFLESRKYLSQLPQAVAIAPYMRLSFGEQKQRINQQPSVIAETFEAVIAAIYQDGGHDCIHNLIGLWFAEAL